MNRSLVAVLTVVLAACRPGEPRAPREGASTVVQQDTAFAGTLAPVQRVRSFPPGVARPVLRDVETMAGASSGAGYDRVVFEFAGDSVPGYDVEYTTAPVRRCGSGSPVALAGAGRLVVRFEPARAHDEQGNPSPAERERATGLPTLKDMKLVCDFEGQVEWVLGVAAAAPYRVSETTGPARLVVDIRHRP